MALISINKNPSVSQLRQFACLFTPLFCIGMAAVLYFKHGSVQGSWIALGVGATFAVVGAVAPQAIKPIFVGSMYVTFPIGWVVSHVLLAGMFFLILTPIGLLMRLFGRDPMQREFDRSVNTYWIRRKPNVNSRNYFKQY